MSFHHQNQHEPDQQVPLVDQQPQHGTAQVHHHLAYQVHAPAGREQLKGNINLRHLSCFAGVQAKANHPQVLQAKPKNPQVLCHLVLQHHPYVPSGVQENM